MKSRLTRLARLLTAAVLLATPALAHAGPDVVHDAMKDELARTKTLSLPDSPSPYWAAVGIVDSETLQIQASFGALVSSEVGRQRALAPRLRVGDHKLDAMGVPMFDEPPLVAYEDDYEGLRHALWLLNDGAYKMAATQYRQELTEKAQTTADPDRPDSYTAAPEAVVLHEAPKELKYDRAALEQTAREVSGVFREQEHIYDSSVVIALRTATRRLASTDDTSITTSDVLAVVYISAQAQAEDGDILSRAYSIVTTPDALPTTAQLQAEASKLAKHLGELRTAPQIKEYNGPILFEGPASAELLGTMLGMQLVSAGRWSRDIEGRMGQLVMPKNVDVVDDPAATTFGGHKLLGGLVVDDEGTRASRVQLVQGGKLVGLLSGREPGKKVKVSNGHARSAPFGMGTRPAPTNLLVTAKKGVAKAAMDKKLLALVKESGAEFGLVVTEGGGFGEAATAYRVGKDGKRQLVRIGHLRGLELKELRDLVAVGNESHAHHGVTMGGGPMPAAGIATEYAGFASAWSVVAPAILVRNAEVTSWSDGNPKPPSYPRPSFRKR